VNDSQAGTAVFFLLPFIVAVIGALVQTRKHHATGARSLELWLVWWMVTSGVIAVFGGLGHIGPNSDSIAEGIGYRQSFFQWEVGWYDIGIGVLLIGSAWRRDLGWLTATVVMWAIGYGGDAIGHAMQWIEHDNTEPSNIWALPSDIIGPAVAIGLLLALTKARRLEGAHAVSA
jgi:hypothetical protein